MIRCKMIVTNKNNSYNPYRQDKAIPNKPICSVVLAAVAGPENKRWAQYTPSGRVELSVDNPEGYDAFVLGETYFVDFHVAPATDAG